jgi:hypothetical protein
VFPVPCSDRHPELRLAITEGGFSWVQMTASQLLGLIEQM